MDDRRLRRRQKTFKGGTISHGIVGGIECLIRNISSTGACLELADPFLCQTTSHWCSSRSCCGATAP